MRRLKKVQRSFISDFELGETNLCRRDQTDRTIGMTDSVRRVGSRRESRKFSSLPIDLESRSTKLKRPEYRSLHKFLFFLLRHDDETSVSKRKISHERPIRIDGELKSWKKSGARKQILRWEENVLIRSNSMNLPVFNVRYFILFLGFFYLIGTDVVTWKQEFPNRTSAEKINRTVNFLEVRRQKFGALTVSTAVINGNV